MLLKEIDTNISISISINMLKRSNKSLWEEHKANGHQALRTLIIHSKDQQIKVSITRELDKDNLNQLFQEEDQELLEKLHKV
jgi:hypothetical protein